MILVFAQFALYGASISSSHRVGLFDIDMTPMFLSTAMGIVFIRISRDSTSNFTPVQRLVYLVGIGGAMIFLGALASYAFERPPEQEMLWPLVVVSDDELRTLPLGMASYQKSYGTRYTELMAVSVYGAIPTLLFFIALQRYFIESAITTGIKG